MTCASDREIREDETGAHVGDRSRRTASYFDPTIAS